MTYLTTDDGWTTWKDDDDEPCGAVCPECGGDGKASEQSDCEYCDGYGVLDL